MDPKNDHTSASSRGDPKAMEALLEDYQEMMAWVIRGILQDPHETEDCLAALRARLWEKLPEYRGERGSLGTWLTALSRNAALDWLRKRKSREGKIVPLEDWMEDPAPGPEEQVLERERQARLKEALGKLPSRDRMLFYRKYYYLQTTEQIAAELGLSRRGVEGRLYRIRARLRNLLGGDPYEL